MSRVRVLVGTRKGAFILTSDGKRKNWKVSGPHFAGWEIYHLKGSPVDPNRIYASQTSGWFGQIIQRSDDGGENWNTPGGGPETDAGGNAEGREQQVRLRRRARHASMVRRHPASVGIQTRLASRTVVDDPNTSMPAWKTPRLFRNDRWRPDLEGTSGCASTKRTSGNPAQAAWPAHDPSRSKKSETHLRRHLRRGRFSHR